MKVFYAKSMEYYLVKINPHSLAIRYDINEDMLLLSQKFPH